MDELFELVKELRKRIKKYKSLLSTSEALTRYVLIDPLLRALGWDTENPDIVRVEERQDHGRPDYVLYLDGRKLIALEAKRFGTKLDEKRILDLGFNYSWRKGIHYFIITDGNIWRIYNVYEPQPEKRLILEINVLEEPIEDVVRKLLSLWRPIIKYDIKLVESVLQPSTEVNKTKTKIKEYAGKTLDLNKVRMFYEHLTSKEKAFIEIVFKAWKQGRVLTKNDIINKLRNRGIDVDERGFTGIKSGITRLAKKMNLSPPMPTSEELGEGYWRDETKRYTLRDEWGKALENIIEYGD